MPIYTTSFYDNREEISIKSTHTILPLVIDLVAPDSVVDVGCGDGGWLSVLYDRFGIDDILGIDGPWVHDAQLRIPLAKFHRSKLDASLEIARKADLAICLEVAEHLPESRAESFVRDLTEFAPVVLFSAAIPEQGGVNHINEQWQDYWADIFSSYSFVAIDCVRPAVWHNENVTIAYRQNMILYAHQSQIESNPKLARESAVRPNHPLRLVHPEMYQIMIVRARPRLGRWLKMGPAVIKRTMKK